MVRDDELRSRTDYSGGQREAASRVLVEIANILKDYSDEILIAGGWVPELLFPDKDHVGTIDVDLLLNHHKLKEASYLTISRILEKNGYRKHPEKYFAFVKTVYVEDIAYEVDLDLLAGKYGGTVIERHSQHVQGLKALKVPGGDFAFEVPPTPVKIVASRPDGAMDTANFNVTSIAPFMVMKAAALGRGKPKDAYDIYFCMKNFSGGIDALAEELFPFREHKLVTDMIEKFKDKFASPDHAGPVDVASFLELSDEEEEMIRRDAYELTNRLIEHLAA